MPLRTNLFLTTALSTASAAWLVSPGQAADISMPSDPAMTYPSSGTLYPAVSEVNYKLEGFGGVASEKSIAGVAGAVSVPLGGQWGFEGDGIIGSWNGAALYSLGGHLFTRDPSSHLVGIFAAWTHSDVSVPGIVSDLDYYHIAVEGEWYRNEWTVRGLAGYEFGDITDRFFTHLKLDYYATPDLRLTAGYGYEGGDNFLMLETEWLTPHELLGARTALFADARIGERNSNSVWGGLKFYFGPSQTLIDKNRRDDPGPEVFVNGAGGELDKLKNGGGEGGGGGGGGCGGGYGC